MLSVIQIRAFSDNYIWLLQGFDKSKAAVVDPGNAAPVLKYLREHSIELTAMMITHEHYDHVDGIADLIKEFPDIPVYGPAKESIPCKTNAMVEGDVVELPEMNLSFQVMDVPGHTLGHIAYYGYGSLFCGDTIFGAGCGRIFTGNPTAFSRTLLRLSELPAETLIYCAHEYTVDDLGFAQWVEPDNQDIKDRDEEALEITEKGGSTVPFSMELELKTNPFLRTSEETVISAASEWAKKPLEGDERVWTVLRQWKDKDYD